MTLCLSLVLDMLTALFDCLSCGWLMGLVGRRRQYEAHEEDEEAGGQAELMEKRVRVTDCLFMLCGCFVG